MCGITGAPPGASLRSREESRQHREISAVALRHLLAHQGDWSGVLSNRPSPDLARKERYTMWEPAPSHNELCRRILQ